MGKGREKEKVLLAHRPHKVSWSWNSVMPYPYTVATGYKLSLCPQGKLLHIKKISSSFLSSILLCCTATKWQLCGAGEARQNVMGHRGIDTSAMNYFTVKPYPIKSSRRGGLQDECNVCEGNSNKNEVLSS